MREGVLGVWSYEVEIEKGVLNLLYKLFPDFALSTRSSQSNLELFP